MLRDVHLLFLNNNLHSRNLTRESLALRAFKNIRNLFSITFYVITYYKLSSDRIAVERALSTCYKTQIANSDRKWLLTTNSRYSILYALNTKFQSVPRGRREHKSTGQMLILSSVGSEFALILSTLIIVAIILQLLS